MIYCVEDDSSIRELMVYTLQASGFEACGFQDAADFWDMMKEKKPERVIELAVKGMLPQGPLGRQMYKKLFVYAGPDHNHQAQKPEKLTF